MASGPITSWQIEGVFSTVDSVTTELLLLLSCPVMSDSLQPHGLQHTRPLCPSPSSEVCPSSCPLHQWCHPTVSSSVISFSSCPQSFPASVFSSESALWIRWPKYWSFSFSISSVQFSRSVMSDSLQPHGLQHTRPLCFSPTPGIYSNSCPLSQWCHPAISSSIVPFSSCPQSFPASVFSKESVLRIRWPKYWSFSFSISLSN